MQKGRNRKSKEISNKEIINDNYTLRDRKHRGKLKIYLKFNHCSKNKARKVSELSSQISTSLSAFSPTKSSVFKRRVKQLSPESKSKVIGKISLAASLSPIIDIYKVLSKRRDNISNCPCMVLSKIARNKKAKQMHGLNWSSLQKAKSDLNKTLIHYKTERQKSKPKPKHVKNVYSFYNKDHISRTLVQKIWQKESKIKMKILNVLLLG